MTREVFDIEWDRWCALFPAGKRNKAAYFVELKHLTDGELRGASKAAVQSHTSRSFPSVGEIMSHVLRRPKEFKPEYPIAGASKDQLRKAYEKLPDFYELAQDKADTVGMPSGADPAPHIKYTMHRVLQKLVAINGEAIKREFHDPEANRQNSASLQGLGTEFSYRLDP